jgi:RNA polymerase sigma factor (sigma-70 family)
LNTFHPRLALYSGCNKVEYRDAMSGQPNSYSGLLQRVVLQSLAGHSDRQLLERFAASGDEAAFAAILERHGPMLFGLCRRLLRDEHLAEDVLQATFLVLSRKAGSIRRRDSLASWLYGVAQRIARQARLADAARTRREKRTGERRGETATHSSDPAWNEILQILDDELQRLPERYRAPLLLCYMEGQTQDEAARQLGWSLSTLRRRLDCGRELLRARMTRRGATLGAGLFAGFLSSTPARATLTPELQRAVLSTAFSGARGGAIPVSVLALANGGMRMAIMSKLCFGLAAAAVMGGIAAGMAWQQGSDEKATQATAAIVNPAPASNKVPVLRDVFNDPLPGGAVARLGTFEFRHGPVDGDKSPLVFTPDGKSLISNGGGWLRRWDIATRQNVVNLGLGLQAQINSNAGWIRTFAAADGKIARVFTGAVVLVDNRTTIAWPCKCTEFDLETGKEKRTYPLEAPRDTHDSHWYPEHMSPDGGTLIEMTRSGGLAVWNAATGAFKYYLKPESEPYSALAFSADGKTVVIGDVEHTFRVFDLETAKELRNFDLPNGNMVYWMAISRDGQWLATAGGKRARQLGFYVGEHDRFLRLWDLKDGRLLTTMVFPEDHGVESLIFTPNSRKLVAGLRGQESGSPAAVRTWDLAGNAGRAWVQDRAIGLYLAVSPDGKTLATINGDGIIRLWDMASGKEVAPFAASPCGLMGVSFRPDGATVIALGNDRALSEWDATTGRRIALARTKIKGSLLKVTADGKYLVTRVRIEVDRSGVLFNSRPLGPSQNGVIRLYDQTTGRLLLEHPGWEAALSRDGKRLAVRSITDPIEILDIESGKVLQTLTLAQELEGPGRRPDGQGGPGFNFQPSRPSAGRPLDFTPDGKSLVVLRDDQNTVSIWDLETAKPSKSWTLLENKIVELSKGTPGLRDRPDSAVLSPDGNQIAFVVLRQVMDPNRYVQLARLVVVEAMNGKIVFQNEWKPDYIGKVAFSPDGKLLATDGAMRTIQIWDIATGKVIMQFEGHRGRINSLAFSPDGKRLASASEDSTVLIWEVGK